MYISKKKTHESLAYLRITTVKIEYPLQETRQEQKSISHFREYISSTLLSAMSKWVARPVLMEEGERLMEHTQRIALVKCEPASRCWTEVERTKTRDESKEPLATVWWFW